MHDLTVLQFLRRSPDTAGMYFDRNLPMAAPRTARAVTAALLLLATFLVWRELEPKLLFRPVEGVVVGSRFIRTYVTRPEHSYLAEINYVYNVNGLSYLSSQYRRTNMRRSLWVADSRTSRYAAGARVQVWYSPLNPADSVLSRSPHPGMFVVFGLSAIMAWWMWRKYSRPSDWQQA